MARFIVSGPGAAVVAPAPVTPEKWLCSETQRRLDAFARERGYDNLLSLCSYVDSSETTFAAEGALGIQIRDETWRALYRIIDEAKAGTRPWPESYDDLSAELPALLWP